VCCCLSLCVCVFVSCAGVRVDRRSSFLPEHPSVSLCPGLTPRVCACVRACVLSVCVRACVRVVCVCACSYVCVCCACARARVDRRSSSLLERAPLPRANPSCVCVHECGCVCACVRAYVCAVGVCVCVCVPVLCVCACCPEIFSLPKLVPLPRRSGDVEVLHPELTRVLLSVFVCVCLCLVRVCALTGDLLFYPSTQACPFAPG